MWWFILNLTVFYMQVTYLKAHNPTSVAEVVLGFVCSSPCHGLFAQVVLGFVYSFSCYGLFVYIDNWLKDSAYKHSFLLCIIFVIKVNILHCTMLLLNKKMNWQVQCSLTTIWGRKCEEGQVISLEYKVLWGKIIKGIVLWSKMDKTYKLH